MSEPTETTRGIDTLVPHARNYNQHPPAQIERLAASLQQFGQVRPIVVHRNTIIAGHGVYLAAQHLNYQTLRVTQLPDAWTDEQALAYLVADNETRRGAEPDAPELAALLNELRPSFDLESLGFDDAEYSALLDGLTPDLPEPGNGGDEFEPDEAASCRVQAGDVWLIGGVHRLICGDCTDPAIVERLMQGERADMLVSDPPYKLTGGGCLGDYFPGGYMEQGKGFIDKSRSKLFECPEFKDWLPVVSSVMQETCECFVMTNDRNLVDLLIALRDARWKHHNLMVWDKNIMVRHDWYLKNCEFIAYGYCGKARKPRDLGRGMLLQIPVNVKEKEHVSEKPVTLMVRLIENHEGDLVLDPFLGSGTTIIAAHRTGRRCYGCEISEAYCEVILQRCEAEGLTVGRVEQG